MSQCLGKWILVRVDQHSENAENENCVLEITLILIIY